MTAELLAGRELDALVAEKVMGKAKPIPPQYSTDIATAWTVVERFDPEQWMWGILRLKQGDRVLYSVSLSRLDDDGYVISDAGRYESETAPLAICRAALAATGEQP
jgi:hypothetical protein